MEERGAPFVGWSELLGDELSWGSRPSNGERWACHGRYFVTNPARIFSRAPDPFACHGMASCPALVAQSQWNLSFF